MSTINVSKEFEIYKISHEKAQEHNKKEQEKIRNDWYYKPNYITAEEVRETMLKYESYKEVK